MLKVKPGVITGEGLKELFAYCKDVDCALPSVNVIGSNSANAAMAAAHEAKAPIIIQFSHTGAQFIAGKTLDNSAQQASIAGAIAGALHVRTLAKRYGVPVVLHTDHCAKKLLPWVDGVIAVGEEYFGRHGEPLFSSHMLDLSEQPLAENIEIAGRTLARIAKMKMTLELEIGITGGEEDGVDNSGVGHERLYTRPEDVLKVYDALTPLGNFNVAASFGNTHGVYAAGNVKLKPTILRDSQHHIQAQRKTGPKPVSFVFHGGSGSTPEEIHEAVSYGVVKMNIDTDTQWAFTHPIKAFMDEKGAYLLSQLGNPEGPTEPNKKYIDPRGWLALGEKGFTARLVQACKDLGSFQKFDF
jgi:fructose-bisphosphate aldolase, class II